MYHLDDCAPCVSMCLSVCVIHLNIYLWAIIYAASVDSSYSVFTVRQMQREKKKNQRGPRGSRRRPLLQQKTDLASRRGFDIKTLPYANPKERGPNPQMC